LQSEKAYSDAMELLTMVHDINRHIELEREADQALIGQDRIAGSSPPARLVLWSTTVCV
jgi:hypothetical protein